MKAAESIAMKEGKLICSGAVRALGLVAQAFFFTGVVELSLPSFSRDKR